MAGERSARAWAQSPLRRQTGRGMAALSSGRPARTVLIQTDARGALSVPRSRRSSAAWNHGRVNAHPPVAAKSGLPEQANRQLRQVARQCGQALEGQQRGHGATAFSHADHRSRVTWRRESLPRKVLDCRAGRSGSTNSFSHGWGGRWSHVVVEVQVHLRTAPCRAPSAVAVGRVACTSSGGRPARPPVARHRVHTTLGGVVFRRRSACGR